MKSFTPELIEKAKTVETAEELLELAKTNNVDLTAEEAATYFAQLNPKSGELDDDDLDSVAGGKCDSGKPSHGLSNGTLVRVITGSTCRKCGGVLGRIYDSNHEYSYERICCSELGHGDIFIECSVKGFTLGVEFELA